MKVDKKKNLIQRIHKSMKKLKGCHSLRVDIYENEYREMEPAEYHYLSIHSDGDKLVGELFNKSAFGWYISSFSVIELCGYGVINMVVKYDKDFGDTNISSDFINLMKETMDSFSKRVEIL